MAIAGLGTDLARVERFRRFVTEGKTALIERLFTAGERGYALAKAAREGRDLGEVLDEFLGATGAPGTTLVAHNCEYDHHVIAGEIVRARRPLEFLDLTGICTMKSTTELCRLPRPGGGYGYKWPTLEELHACVFGRSYEGAHDAARDIEACARAFFRLREAGHFRF